MTAPSEKGSIFILIAIHMRPRVLQLTSRPPCQRRNSPHLMKSKCIIPLCLFIQCANAFAHSDHEAKKDSPAVNPLTFALVRSEGLTDPELKDFKVVSTTMTIAPGAVDAAAHRHDGELFGYVLKGSIQIGLGDEPPQTYATGQMFFEKRNVLHAVTKNLSKDQPAEVLLFFIVKEGRSGYTAEVSSPTKSP